MYTHKRSILITGPFLIKGYRYNVLNIKSIHSRCSIKMNTNQQGGKAVKLTTEQPDSTNLTDKVILVTGASQRVGRETVRYLHAAGAQVVIHYRHSATEAKLLQQELNKSRPDSAAILSCDLANIESLPTLIEQTQQTWGRLDALVNNASSFYPTQIGETTLAQWNDLFSANLQAPFFLAQAAAPHLKQNRGNIINIVDIHADRPLRGHTVYCMAKAGLAMLTKSLACELGPEVRVNGVAPGAILWPDTNMDEATKQRITDKTFLKRRGNPVDIAKAVLYLIKDATYTTGQILAVDGGRSLNT